MIKSRRKHVNKHAAARGFRHDMTKTHAKNMQPRPMRGGFRL